MNFQVTVLKILVSYPEGFAVMADLKRDMAILATSGPEWAERTKRMATRVPGLDIFSDGLVERQNGGWRITVKGRAVLESMEARRTEHEPVEKVPVETAGPPVPILAAAGRASEAPTRTAPASPRSPRTRASACILSGQGAAAAQLIQRVDSSGRCRADPRLVGPADSSAIAARRRGPLECLAVDGRVLIGEGGDPVRILGTIKLAKRSMSS
ncbi:hypothetical protein Bra471DRAFT_01557 [Bradyrhizobium sp. WSM471]|nr:hypothetical protein Bra471DRAFT_01557 [Bradyrhizobium sp. WSM471]